MQRLSVHRRVFRQPPQRNDRNQRSLGRRVCTKEDAQALILAGLGARTVLSRRAAKRESHGGGRPPFPRVRVVGARPRRDAANDAVAVLDHIRQRPDDPTETVGGKVVPLDVPAIAKV